MDDLISRQALIDAFKEEFYMMCSDDLDYMIKFFRNLPTANPSVVTIKLTEADKESLKKAMNEGKLTLMPSEIIHCKECVYYGKDYGICDLGGSWEPDDYCSYGRRPITWLI